MHAAPSRHTASAKIGPPDRLQSRSYYHWESQATLTHRDHRLIPLPLGAQD